VASNSSEAAAHNKDLESTLAALRVQYAQQQQDLQAQRSDFARLQSQSKDDRAALLTQLTAQLQAKTSALEDEQRRLASIQAQANQQRDAYNKELEQRSRDASAAAGELQQDKEALHVAQDQLTQQREALQQLQLQSAAQQLKLVQERENLAMQLTAGSAGKPAEDRGA
jgi:chromosome segregation ATPase